MMVNEWPNQGPACSPWEHSPAAREAGGAPRQPGDPGRPSVPAPPAALPPPTQPPRSAGITICGLRWAASQWVEDSDFGQGRAPWLCSGGPGWAGSPPGPTRAQVALTSLSQAWPQDCKTKTPPLILCSLFSLARLRRLIPFIRSLTHPRKVLLVPADIEMNGSPATPRHSTVPTRKARSCFLSFILRIASLSGSPAVPMAKDKTTL